MPAPTGAVRPAGRGEGHPDVPSTPANKLGGRDGVVPSAAAGAPGSTKRGGNGAGGAARAKAYGPAPRPGPQRRIAGSSVRRAAAQARRMFQKIEGPGMRSAKSRRSAVFE